MVVAVGFFDGVHLGHQAILSEADMALTFKEHPLTVLSPDRAPKLIMSLDERLAACRACGVKEVVALDFTPNLAAQTPEEFIAFLIKLVGAENLAIRAGENWRFGCGGKGDAAFLRARQIPVDLIPYAVYKGERISSSRIRACLSRGEMEDAAAMMGRKYAIVGTREEGKHFGRKIGFPTINLHPSSLAHLSSLIPLPSQLIPYGVYEVMINGEKGIANYGLAPTFGEQAWADPILEVHLLSSSIEASDIPLSARVTVEIVRFLRPEKNFSSVDDLKAQIAKDILAATSDTNFRN